VIVPIAQVLADVQADATNQQTRSVLGN